VPTTAAFQIALAAMFAEVIEWMKKTQNPAFTWITARTETVSRVLSWLVAALTSVGLAIAWVVDPETGRATLNISGLPATWPAFLDLFVIAFQQYWLQKGWYKGLIKGSENSAEAQLVHPKPSDEVKDRLT
jgi:ABC-type proline/glycine betaine transport system permease subunit